MGEALYRKYRSRSFDEIVGQEHITATLKNALKTGRISHAYLFTGPRGSGKTSIARILAYEVNGMPYSDKTDTHLDIIEIDAASNRRIDEIREIRDKVHIAPVHAKYKVYIIDEVHMLTKEAFNALLKTLEEPPKHVIFVLATTEVHKLPETIISRTQRFAFKPVANEKVVAHLSEIAKKEKITISSEALGLIAKHGEGSFRDSISLLDQVENLHKKKVELADVEQLLGIAPQELVDKTVGVIEAGTPKDALDLIVEIEASGFNTASVAKQVSARLRDLLLNGQTLLGGQTITELLAKLLEVPIYKDPDRYFELILLECSATRVEPPQAAVVTQETVVIDTPYPQIAQPDPSIDDVKAHASRTPQKAAKATALDETVWKQALLQIKKRHNTLYGVARMATPRIEGNTLVLELQFAFHQKQLNDQKNQKIIRDIISDLTQQPVQLRCEVVAQTQTNKTKPQPSATLDTITNIFGGGELLED